MIPIQHFHYIRYLYSVASKAHAYAQSACNLFRVNELKLEWVQVDCGFDRNLNFAYSPLWPYVLYVL